MQNVKRRIENAECKVQSEKKMYKSTKLEFILLTGEDIITSSPGTETTPKEENDGIWDLDLS